MNKTFIYENNVWKFDPRVKKEHSQFIQTELNYLNQLDPLFKKARETSEFQFILCLLRYKGHIDVGWDPFETFIKNYEALKTITTTSSLYSSVTDPYVLFMYGLIMEASEPYEFLANLLNVIEGETYRLNNFPDDTDASGKKRSQPFQNKIDQIKSRAKKQNIKITLFSDFVDNKLRNSIFHSDYSLHFDEIRILHPIKRYTHDEWMILVNNAFAYIEAFMGLYYTYIGIYEKPELIDAPRDFIHYPNEKVITIVRKGYGLIGIKDNWTQEQISRGYIPIRILPTCFRYEISLIEKGQLLLPIDRVKQFNKFIKPFPKFMKIFLVKMFTIIKVFHKD